MVIQFYSSHHGAVASQLILQVNMTEIALLDATYLCPCTRLGFIKYQELSYNEYSSHNLFLINIIFNSFDFHYNNLITRFRIMTLAVATKRATKKWHEWGID